MNKRLLKSINLGLLGLYFIIAGFILLLYKQCEYQNIDSVYSSVSSEFTSHGSNTSSVVPDVSDATELESSDANVKWYELLNVDFDGLKSKNNEVIGWIFFEDMDLSYPIMYSGDNQKYLENDWEGNPSIGGAIFLEQKNNPNFQDSHSILYGHNMKNMSMFGKLKNYYKDSDFWKDNQYFQIICPEVKYRYRIVACRAVDDDDDIYSVFKGNSRGNREFTEFIREKVLGEGLLNTNYELSSYDYLVTLSTCFLTGKRFIVTAVQDEISYR